MRVDETILLWLEWFVYRVDPASEGFLWGLPPYHYVVWYRVFLWVLICWVLRELTLIRYEVRSGANLLAYLVARAERQGRTRASSLQNRR